MTISNSSRVSGSSSSSKVDISSSKVDISSSEGGSREPNSASQADSMASMVREIRRGPVPQHRIKPQPRLDLKSTLAAADGPLYLAARDQQHDARLQDADDRWKAVTTDAPAEPALEGLFIALRDNPDRRLSAAELAFCLPSEAHLDAVNPHAMPVGMQLGSVMAGGTTGYLTSFGLAELVTGMARASGHIVPAWGHGVMAGSLHGVMAEVFGSAIRGNRGVPGSPANKAFDACLKQFCDGVESAIVNGQPINFAPLRELVTRHLWIHLASDELAFSAFGVSGAAAAYINGIQLPSALPPALERAAYETTAALTRILLGAFVGGVGTAGLQHLLRPAIQGVPPPAPGKIHRPERLAYMEWKHATALEHRKVVLELARLNLEARFGQTPGSDLPEVDRLNGERIQLAEALFELEQMIHAGGAALGRERAALGDTDEPMTAGATLRADMNSVRTQFSSKAADWSAARSTMALCVSNAAAAALGFLVPIAATAGAVTSLGNTTAVNDHYLQPLDDFTASGLMPVTMIASWMLTRKPLKVAVETGLSVMAGLAMRVYGSAFGEPHAHRPDNEPAPVQDTRAPEEDQAVGAAEGPPPAPGGG